MSRPADLLVPALLAACLLLTPAVAQESEATSDEDAAQTEGETEAPAEGDAPQPQTQSGGDLSLGEPLQTEPQVGQTYTADTFTDWELRCVKTEDGNDPCQLYQLLQDEQGNAVAEVTLFPLPEGGQAVAGATIITPLETLLTSQLRLQVDQGDIRRYPFAFCSQVGCFSRLGFTAPEIAGFRAGNAATVTINPAGSPDTEVNLTLSLSGFTAGFEAAQDSQRAAAE